jgi:inner membrane protein
MIQEIISEREHKQTEAINEVSSKWGKEQTIAGPMISIPYSYYVKKTVSNDTTQRVEWFQDFIHILPNELNIQSEVMPELRKRGIYEIVVYNTKIKVSGKFSNLNLSQFDIQPENIQFDNAKLLIGITDLRGIEKQIKLRWNGEYFNFNPGVTTNDVVYNGINSPIKINLMDSTDYDFSFSLDLKGSQLLYFTPVGKVTDVNMTSVWKNPSFEGAFLPDSRKVTNHGFTANWNILNLNRNYPQAWTGSKFSLNESAFGINLLLPVDNYQKSYRAIRYAILFIGFTFMVFFFIEVLNRYFIHPVQYILVGIALVIFFILLISISEQLNFNSAYIISAIATLLLIAGYIKAILKSTKLTFLISGILLILYSFIFIIIQLQDLSLLIGSIGIFIVLGLVMYFSRKIDWDNIVITEKEVPEE